MSPAPIAHMRLVPTRSASLPAGTAKKNDTTPATVRPMPTWAAERPTIWVKKTAEPVMKVPSPTAKRIDWTDSDRASGDGGSWRCHQDCAPGSRRVSVPSIVLMLAEPLAFVV